MRKLSFKNKLFLLSMMPTFFMVSILLCINYIHHNNYLEYFNLDHINSVTNTVIYKQKGLILFYQNVAYYISVLFFSLTISFLCYQYVSKKIVNTELSEQVEMAIIEFKQNLDLLEEKNVQLNKEKKRLEEKNKQQSEFIANISHEIRSPLSGILGFTNLMFETVMSETQKNYIKMIHSTSSELLITLNDLLDYSKIEAGKLTFNQVPFNLKRCIDEILTHTTPHAYKKDLEIIPIIGNDIPQSLIGDPTRIKQVLTNLIDNAIKFTDHGHILLSVTLQEQNLDSIYVCISITDTGMGIHPDEQELLFNPFHQANPNIVKKYGGSGLGLAICKKIVEAMQGKIELTSKLNLGTTFSVYLKFKKVILQNNSITHQNNQNELPQLKETLKLINPKILIAEDQKINQQFIFSLLNPLCQLVITNNGSNAINLTKNDLFNIIILDKYMPDIDGISVSKNIRNNSINKNSPIIIMSAECEPEDFAYLITNATWLLKPCHDIDFLKNIISICKQTNIDLIDWNLCLKKVSGNKSLALKFLHALVQELPEHKQNLIDATKNLNIKKIHYIAHKLNGACCFSGIPKLHDSAINLENMTKKTSESNKLNSDLNKAVIQLNQDIDEVLLEYKKFNTNQGHIYES